MAHSVAEQFVIGETGQGEHGRIVALQERCSLDFRKRCILGAVESIPFNGKDTGPFTIADYGTADGCVSMPLITELIELLRKKHGEIPIQIVYEDQTGNDFNSLVKRIHGMLPDPLAYPTYLKRFNQVYVMASGTSFFDQVLPDNTAHLIMSFNAVQYLSELPTKYQDSLHRFPDASEREHALATRQAAKDWETFLLHRARELKTGGLLIVSTPCDDPEMKVVEGVRHSVQNIEEGLARIWRQMRDEGKITREEYLNTNFQRCTRRMKELTVPVEDPDSKVYKAGLRLYKAETVLNPCVHEQIWRKKLGEEGVDDRQTFAKSFVQEERTWTVNVLLRGLASTRSDREKEALVNELYERLEQKIMAQGPEDPKNRGLRNYVYIRKV